jgi:signal transduction histidine kinase
MLVGKFNIVKVESVPLNPGKFSAKPFHTGDMARTVRSWWRPLTWGISLRSAYVSAAVVLVALAVAGVGLTWLLYRSLLSAVDDAAAARLHDITAALRAEPTDAIDDSMLATDQRVVAVQIFSADGRLRVRSAGASDTPLVPIDRVGSTPIVGMSDDASSGNNMRISAQRVDTPSGQFTVLVGGGSESVESTVETVALLLCAAAPIVIVVVAGATYVLVKRSLRSVDAIRARVAEISSSDLAERVPVPETHDEISALAVTMNAMLARVEAGQVAQRQFVGDASHELRSPLAIIISALDVAAAHPELLDHDLATTTLMPEAHRMRALVDDLLLLARADERGLALYCDTVHLEDIISADAARLRRHTRLSVHTDSAPVEVIGDQAALARVVRNLTDNAARYAASRVDLGLHRRADRVVMTVADDGPGIPPADRVRVFDRFVRLDTDRARTGGGSGLGLAIVAEIVAAHHGTVDITDRAGDGTLVVVQLPLESSNDSSR